MSFFSKIEAAFKKIFGSTKWEQTLSAVITYAAPLVQLLVSLAAGPAAGTIVGSVASTIQSDLGTLKAVVDGATSAPSGTELQTVNNALNSIQANLGALLTDADVKNSSEAAQITSIATSLIGEFEAALKAIGASAPAPAPPATLSTPAA